MTIELITGTPGSGKTCYAVSQRLVGEAGRQVIVEDALGQAQTVTRRICVSGIKGLTVQHERLPHPLTNDKVNKADLDKWNAVDANGDPVHTRLPFTEALDVEASVYNWWLWCKPGDLIVVDEIQFIMARGTLGQKSPPYLGLLAMHRHYGVDFLVITQHPDFLDPFIRKLVGMHRHVRSVMGTSLCMVYEWDHASNPERYTLAVKSKYLRRAKHYALYKSAAAYIKPPSSGRGIVWMMGTLLLVGAGLAYTFAGHSAFAKAGKPAESVPARVVAAGALQAPVRPVGWRDAPKVTGCYAYADKCKCIGVNGMQVNIELNMCKASAAGFDGLIQWEPRPVPVEPETRAAGVAGKLPLPTL